MGLPARHRGGDRTRRFGAHDAVEWTRRVGLAGLVIECQDDATLEVAGAEVVMPLAGRVNAVPGEDHCSPGDAARAEALGVEILAGGELQRAA